MILSLLAAAAAISALALAALWRLRRRPKTTAREWEEAILLYAGGGPERATFPSEHELCDRAFNTHAFSEALRGAGVFARQTDAREVTRAAAERLIARRAACRPLPPEGSDPRAKSPDHLLVLTPQGAAEAREVWERERGKR